MRPVSERDDAQGTAPGKGVLADKIGGRGVRVGLIVLAVSLLLGGNTPVFGQRLEITPFMGYQFGGNLGVREGDINVKDRGNFGFIINTTVRYGYQFEFSYSRQETELELREFPSGRKRDLFGMAIEYYQIGGLAQRGDPSGYGEVMPFGLVTLGLTRFDPYKAGYSDEWRFSAAFGIGSKFYFSERLGLRLQARVLIPFQLSGMGAFCSSGDCSFTFGGSSSILQGDVFAGLVIPIGR